MRSLIIGVCLLFIWLFGTGYATKSGKQKLLHSFEKYDKLLVPDGPDGEALNVTHDIDLKRIISLDNQVLVLDTFISMTWRDGQLVWNPALYDGLEMIRLPGERVWQPDIMLENNANQFHGLHSGYINMVITYDGFVFYVPPVKTHSFCKVNYAKLKQGNVVTCQLTFLSWTYGDDVINLLNTNDAITTADFDAYFNRQWQYVTSNVERDVKYYACCVEPYIKLKYVIKLRYIGN